MVPFEVFNNFKFQKTRKRHYEYAASTKYLPWKIKDVFFSSCEHLHNRVLLLMYSLCKAVPPYIAGVVVTWRHTSNKNYKQALVLLLCQ
jgi:hypothetical protein